ESVGDLQSSLTPQQFRSPRAHGSIWNTAVRCISKVGPGNNPVTGVYSAVMWTPIRSGGLASRLRLSGHHSASHEPAHDGAAREPPEKPAGETVRTCSPV